ncbi:hypothetical protein [Pseudoruegeria sp. HB172150]|uniref:hypothetical protein n=1 Tax=Pseudoruegeria sp. HB172150 TaxID=2721164 RepID=UPI0015561A5C|nr:hypothetical protein [Pseudoruegeria sp. HB172150]
MKHVLALLLLASPAFADVPAVEDATATRSGDTWQISVTLSHPDTGWDHYADGWEVLTPDGERLGFRELLHPHVDEQPFTRSLSVVSIPEGIDSILIRPHCSQDGWADETFVLKLTR